MESALTQHLPPAFLNIPLMKLIYTMLQTNLYRMLPILPTSHDSRLIRESGAIQHLDHRPAHSEHILIQPCPRHIARLQRPLPMSSRLPRLADTDSIVVRAASVVGPLKRVDHPASLSTTSLMPLELSEWMHSLTGMKDRGEATEPDRAGRKT
jgi:hypothetical protein